MLRYQKNWMADEAQVKIAEKSRRVGITWAEAADDVLIAAAIPTSKLNYINQQRRGKLVYVGEE